MTTLTLENTQETMMLHKTAVPRRKLDEGIALLRSDLVDMADVARCMVADAMTALQTGDTALAESVIERDATVDQLDQSIEAEAIRLVATQQPVAYDLRFIGTALKVTTDIERVGDHAVNIARTVMRLAQVGKSTPVPLEVTRMGTLALQLIGSCAEAYSDDNGRVAQQIIERDDDMDVLYREAQSELRGRMRDTPSESVAASHLLFVAHYLERIGDHCANAAERLTFLLTGRVFHS